MKSESNRELKQQNDSQTITNTHKSKSNANYLQNMVNFQSSNYNSYNRTVYEK